MIAVPCKEAVAGERTGVMVVLSTPGNLHEFEVDSHDKCLRLRITKLNLKSYKEHLDSVRCCLTVSQY